MRIEKLFLCEKPSQGRDIARILKCTQKGEGSLSNSHTTVTWCFGHLLETVPPDQYCENIKPWREEILPIIPDQWKMAVKSSSKKQFQVIKNLLKETAMVVIATDADREGEVIAREILELCHFRGQIKRLWLSALDDDSIHKALNDLRDGYKTENLYQAGLGRQRADWLIGMNMTMAATVLFQKEKHEVLSVGRVQTPTLKLILDRDQAIENFISQKYFELVVQFKAENKPLFLAKWQMREARPGEVIEEPYKYLHQDNDKTNKRCYDAVFIQTIANKIKGQTGTIEAFEEANKHTSPPLCFSLSQLQKTASGKFGFSAQKTLEIAQSLYEIHKGITYPRTDCSYLPLSQFAEASDILGCLQAIHEKNPDYGNLIAQCDLSFESPVWNDKKITAHHGMIPTRNPNVCLEKLHSDELKLYDLICRHYLAQFLGNYEYAVRSVTLSCQDELFKSTSHTPLKPGWKSVFPESTEKTENPQTDEEDILGELPFLEIGEKVWHGKDKVTVHQTKPPPHYTEGTLIEAMKSIGKHLLHENYKKILKETAGIGTEATRANIIETLFKREYIQARGKSLCITPKGKSLIGYLPEKLSNPCITAELEEMLNEVACGTLKLDSALRSQRYFLEETLDELFTQHRSLLAEKQQAQKTYRCESCRSELVRKKNIQKEKHFWGCSRYPVCKFTAQDLKGQPIIKAAFQN